LIFASADISVPVIQKYYSQPKHDDPIFQDSPSYENMVADTMINAITFREPEPSWDLEFNQQKESLEDSKPSVVKRDCELPSIGKILIY